MTCDEALIIFSAQMDGESTSTEDADLRRHLADCPPCRALAADLLGIHRVMGDLAAAECVVPAGLTEGVKKRISATKVVKWKQWRSLAALAAVFAVVVLGAGPFRQMLQRGAVDTGDTSVLVASLTPTPEEIVADESPARLPLTVGNEAEFAPIPEAYTSDVPVPKTAGATAQQEPVKVAPEEKKTAALPQPSAAPGVSAPLADGLDVPENPPLLQSAYRSVDLPQPEPGANAMPHSEPRQNAAILAGNCSAAPQYCAILAVVAPQISLPEALAPYLLSGSEDGAAQYALPAELFRALVDELDGAEGITLTLRTTGADVSSTADCGLVSFTLSE